MSNKVPQSQQVMQKKANNNNSLQQQQQQQIYTQQNNQKHFMITLIILQIIMIILYGIFIRVQPHTDSMGIVKYFPMFQDTTVMVIFAIGFLNSYIRKFSYTGIVHNFLYSCVSFQMFFLLSTFWKKLLVDGFHYTEISPNSLSNEMDYKIYFRQQDFTLAAYSVGAVNAAMAIVFGRVGFFQYLIMNIICNIVYTLNSTILVNFIIVYDVGGSIFGHAFGAYFGMATSYMISKYHKPITRISHSWQTILFSFIGCFFLFCFNPSINAIYLTQSPFQKSLVIINTTLGLLGSVVSSYAMSLYLRKNFSVIDMFNGSLAGGIGVGASSGLYYNPAASLIIGVLSGVICILGMQYLTKYIQQKFNIYDTFGVHNVKGLPGIFGGLMGAVGIATSSDMPPEVINRLVFFTHNLKKRTLAQMVGYQVLGTFCCVFMGIIGGLIAGFIITKFYKLQPKNFYQDKVYFRLSLNDDEHALRPLKMRSVDNKLNNNNNVNVNDINKNNEVNQISIMNKINASEIQLNQASNLIKVDNENINNTHG